VVADAGVGGAYDALDGEGGRVDVELFVGLFADAAVEARGCNDFRRDDGALGAGEVLEGVLEPTLALLGVLLLLLLFFSLRCGVVCAGGFGFFCVFFKEAEEELCGVDLFAFCSVDFFKKSGDEFVFESDEFALLFDFSGEFGDLFFERFDGSSISNLRASYEISYQGLWRPSRRSMPSVSMARAVGLRMSFLRPSSMSCGQLNVPFSSRLATTQ
jgi:hypothetical protein